MKNQILLNQYFSTDWHARIENRPMTGPTLISKVKDYEWVLDVGCGFNYFEGKIDNLIGIDPANDAAHFKESIEEFISLVQFDVAFCLGSINFGDENDIRNDLTCLMNHLKPKARIYWRCNPGVHDHGNASFDPITVFPWTMELQQKFAEEFGFTINEICWESGNRIYAEWVRE